MSTERQPSTPGSPATRVASAPATSAPRPFRRLLWLLPTGILWAVGFYFGLEYAVVSFTHESTDDAFLESHIVTVASRVPGQVTAVHVKENQRVTPGEAPCA